MSLNSDLMLPQFVRSVPQIADLLQAEDSEIALLNNDITAAGAEQNPNNYTVSVLRDRLEAAIGYPVTVTENTSEKGLTVTLFAETVLANITAIMRKIRRLKPAHLLLSLNQSTVNTVAMPVHIDTTIYTEEVINA